MDNEELPEKDNCGLWIQASFFNHSCISNCSRIFIGDVMVIHTLEKIPKDNELTVQYFTNEKFYEERQKISKESNDISVLVYFNFL